MTMTKVECRSCNRARSAVWADLEWFIDEDNHHHEISIRMMTTMMMMTMTKVQSTGVATEPGAVCGQNLDVLLMRIVIIILWACWILLWFYLGLCNFL